MEAASSSSALTSSGGSSPLAGLPRLPSGLGLAALAAALAAFHLFVFNKKLVF